MKFMLMMNAPGAPGPGLGVANWSPEDLKAHIRFMKRFAEELKDSGRAGCRRRSFGAGASQNRASGQGRHARGDRRAVRRGQSSSPATASSTSNGRNAPTRSRAGCRRRLDLEALR